MFAHFMPLYAMPKKSHEKMRVEISPAFEPDILQIAKQSNSTPPRVVNLMISASPHISKASKARFFDNGSMASAQDKRGRGK